MSDLIDRQAAIDALCDNCNHVQAVCPHYPCKQYTSIERLPSATQTNDSNTLNALGWIPVTELLPEEDKYVLVSTEDNDIDIARYDYNEWVDDPEIEWWNGEYRVFPTAWMPLPEPYRKETEDAEIH